MIRVELVDDCIIFNQRPHGVLHAIFIFCMSVQWKGFVDLRSLNEWMKIISTLISSEANLLIDKIIPPTIDELIHLAWVDTQESGDTRIRYVYKFLTSFGLSPKFLSLLTQKFAQTITLH